MNKYSQRSIAIFIPEKNFHDLEFTLTKDILEKSGFRVFITSENKHLSYGQFGLRIKPDTYLFNLHPENFVALILIGGTGSRNYWNNSLLLRVVKQFANKKKIIAGICSAVGILASAELLKGKKATCFVDDRETIISSGAEIVELPVVIDNGIITASRPEATESFAKSIIQLIDKMKR